MNNVLLWLLALVSIAVQAADFEMVSLQDGTQLPPSEFQGGGGNAQPAITPDGRYVVFTGSSWGSEPIVPGLNSSHWAQVLLRDRLTDTTEIISLGYDGLPANGPGGYFLSISNDGCRVVFDSTASNLVPGDNTNKNVFVRYRCGPKAGMTEMVDVDPSGQPRNVGFGDYGYISPDGSKVAFYFYGAGIVPGLKNKDNFDCQDALYIRDLDTGTTTAPTYNGYCVDGAGPALSYDGNRMAFWSYGTYDLPNPNSMWQIWVYDASKRSFQIASSNSAGAGQRQRYLDSCPGEGTSTTTIPAISSDGHYVAFRSRGAGLTSLDSCSGISQLYVKNIDTGAIVMASVNSQGQPGDADSSGSGAGERPGSVTSGGRFVTFYTLATNLVPGESDPGAGKIAVRDLWNHVTDGPVVPGINNFSWPAMSLSGRHIAVYSSSALDPRFQSNATYTTRGYFLLDRGVPMSPVAVSLVSSGSSIIVSFTPGDPGLSPVTAYTAQCVGKNGSSGTATGAGSPLTVTGLKGGLTYWCSVSATNSYGSSDASNVLKRKGASIVPILGIVLN